MELRDRRRVVIFRRAEPDWRMGLAWFPTANDAEAAARDLRTAPGLPPGEIPMKST